MHSQTKEQELQATRKTAKEQQKMARQIENEKKKKVSSFLMHFLKVIPNVATNGKSIREMINKIYIVHISNGTVLLVHIGPGFLPLK